MRKQMENFPTKQQFEKEINFKCDKDDYGELYRNYLRISNALDPIVRNQAGLRRLMNKVRDENTMAEMGVDENDGSGLDKNAIIKRFQRVEDQIKAL
jgi:hypothetical protein